MADKSSSLTTSAINRAKWSSGSQSCSEGGNKNSCSRLQTRNRLLISESYEIPALAHTGFLLIAYLSPTHSGAVHDNDRDSTRSLSLAFYRPYRRLRSPWRLCLSRQRCHLRAPADALDWVL